MLWLTLFLKDSDLFPGRQFHFREGMLCKLARNIDNGVSPWLHTSMLPKRHSSSNRKGSFSNLNFAKRWYNSLIWFFFRIIEQSFLSLLGGQVAIPLPHSNLPRSFHWALKHDTCLLLLTDSKSIKILKIVDSIVEHILLYRRILIETPIYTSLRLILG